jgi:hypothetical protein
MRGEITSLEFTCTAPTAGGHQAAHYTLTDMLEHVRPDRVQELLDDLRAAAGQLIAAEAHARPARRGALDMVTIRHSGPGLS